MIELYFLIYRIPKMMMRLARERNRSAIPWSLIGIAAWLGGEFLAAILLGGAYGFGAAIFGWPEEPPGIFVLPFYVLIIGAAIGSLTLVRRILYNKSVANYQIPPPRFD